MNVGDYLLGNESELGYEVECVLSGVRGKIASMVHSYGGTVQFAVTPKSAPEKNELHDGWNFDYNQLKYLGPGVSDRRVPATTVNIELGSEVRDKFTNIKGTAYRRVTFLNGCVFFFIVRKVPEDKDQKELPNLFVPWQQLVIIEKRAILADREVAPVAPVVSKKPPGGPSSKAYRI